MNIGSLLFGFSGRINRGKYWLTVVIWLVISAIVVAVAGTGIYASGSLDPANLMAVGFGYVAILVIWVIVMLVSGIAIGIKRLHDRDKTGWWLLLFYLAPAVLNSIGESIGGVASMVFALGALAITIWMIVELGFLRGTSGPNQYGPDPLQAS